MSLFGKLKESLKKTKDSISSKVEIVINSFKKIDEELFEELEEVLITADIGVNTSLEIIDRLRKVAREKGLTDSSELNAELSDILVDILEF